MNLNADFTARAALHTQDMPWVASPVAGVERRMLDRLGDEVARATTLVRYAPGSHFSAHVHSGGEEFIVLDGVFQDEHGDYPAGTYVRNPPTSHHSPCALGGATIFVKLWQFDPDDRRRVVIDTLKRSAASSPGRPGVREIPLFHDEREHVRIEIWQPGFRLALSGHRGLEVLVLDGGFTEGGEPFGRHDWLRLPANQTLQAVSGPQGARLWVKSGHLDRPQSAPGQ